MKTLLNKPSNPLFIEQVVQQLKLETNSQFPVLLSKIKNHVHEKKRKSQTKMRIPDVQRIQSYPLIQKQQERSIIILVTSPFERKSRGQHQPGEGVPLLPPLEEEKVNGP